MKFLLVAILASFLVASVAPLSVNAQTEVRLRDDMNVTVEGVLLSATQAQSLDLQLRTLAKAGRTGLRGVATTATGVDATTKTASVALGATYTKAANETEPHLPLCTLAYFVQSPSECFYVPDPPIENFNTLLSLNTIGSFPYALDEVDQNGAVVKRIVFEDLTWPRTPLSAGLSSDKYLAVFQWVANLTGGGTASVAFVQSSILGVVDFDTTPVLPKAWQTIVHIADFPFANSKNRLMLEVMAATGFSINRTVAGLISRANLNASSAFDTAYCQMDSQAQLDANRTADVTSTTFDLVRTPAVANLDFAPILAEQLTLRYGTFGVWRSNVTFPANEGNVWFQIRTAIGQPLNDVGYGETSGSGHAGTGNSGNASPASTLYHSVSSTLVLLLALYLFC